MGKRAGQRGCRGGTIGESQRRTRGKGERGEKRDERDVEIKGEREEVKRKRERGRREGGEGEGRREGLGGKKGMRRQVQYREKDGREL